jgi:CRP-like cAMP-binding protein
MASKKLDKLFSKRRSFKKGEILLRPGEKISKVYYLEKGAVRQCTRSPSGKEVTIHVFRPGSYFPLAVLLAGVSNRFFFEANTQTVVKIAKAKEAVEFVKNDPSELLDLTKRLSKAVDGLSLRIETQLTKKSHDRIDLILSYFESRGPARQLTHKRIASWVGVSRETVSRYLSKKN